MKKLFTSLSVVILQGLEFEQALVITLKRYNIFKIKEILHHRISFIFTVTNI
jgi:hypothetical protein